MGVIAKLLGPKSKYDKSLPFTYEARIRIFEEVDEYKSYFSDTVCGLIEHLRRIGVGPRDADVFELYIKRETRIPSSLLADAEGKWLTRSALCRAFERHYPGHIRADSCSFEDRAQDCMGP